MDFDTLFPILLLVFYFLLQLRGNKKKKQAAQRPPAPLPQPTLQEPQAPLETAAIPKNELDLALREIRQALGMPPPVTQPPPVPKPRHLSAAEAFEHPPLQKRPFKSAGKPIRKPSTFDDTFNEAGAPAFDAGASFGEPFLPDKELFEHEPAFQAKAPKRTVPLEAAPPLKAVRGTPLQKRLRSAKLAREAFVLSEILGPPRSRKP